MRSKNETINKLLDDNEITKEEYDILFCNKLDFKKTQKDKNDLITH